MHTYVNLLSIVRQYNNINKSIKSKKFPGLPDTPVWGKTWN